MELRRQLSVLRHWFWFLVAGVLVGGGSAFLVSNALPKIYEGRATLIVGQSLTALNPDYTQLLASQRLSQTYAELATTTPILQRAIDRIGLRGTAQELRRRVDAQAPRESTLVTISASDPLPENAAAIANAVATELVAASPAIQGRQGDVQQFIDAELRSLQAQIQSTQAEVSRLGDLPSRTPTEEQELQTLQGRLTSLRSTYASLLQFSSNSSSNLLTVVEPASPAPEPSSPRVVLNTLLAAMLGLLMAAAIAFLAEYLDDTVKGPDEVEDLLGLPTLGAINRMAGDAKRSEVYRLVTLLYPRSPAAETFRTLRTNVEFASVDRALKSILVTSSIPGEGKTTTSANLAVAFAQVGRRVMLLDADMRKPGIHRIFDLQNQRGLTDLLRTDAPVADHFVHETEQENLRVLTTGALPPNPAELLASERMKRVIDHLQSVSDLLIVDSPPLQAVTDAAILSSIVDGTLLVIDAGRTKRTVVRHAREALAKAGARVLGVTINRLSGRGQGAYYYSYYGGAYGYGSGSERVPDNRHKSTVRT